MATFVTWWTVLFYNSVVKQLIEVQQAPVDRARTIRKYFHNEKKANYGYINKYRFNLRPALYNRVFICYFLCCAKKKCWEILHYLATVVN
uniref:ABC transmembrane type-1 domain-containing protein n=1 Tax=Amphimedon queenslandica TaxID=400682 RepID=A0A1X7SMT4_AMPQE